LAAAAGEIPVGQTLYVNNAKGNDAFDGLVPEPTADGKFGPMPNSNWLGHLKHQGWFTEPQAPVIFFLNGKPGPNVLKLDDIPAGGFFYDTQSSPRRLCFRLPAGARLADCKLELPLNRGFYVSDGSCRAAQSRARLAGLSATCFTSPYERDKPWPVGTRMPGAVQYTRGHRNHPRPSGERSIV